MVPPAKSTALAEDVISAKCDDGSRSWNFKVMYSTEPPAGALLKKNLPSSARCVSAVSIDVT